MSSARKSALQLSGLAFAIAVGVVATTSAKPAVLQALLWLPSGVAVAGAALLGGSRRALAVVFAMTATGRLLLAYEPWYAGIAACGSTAEAWIGARLLRPVIERGRIERIRDVAWVYLAACAAPVGSLAAAAVARSIDAAPVLAGFTGWWRMNAIAILLVVPLALAWANRRSSPVRVRQLAEAAAAAAVAVALVGVIMLLATGVTAVVLLLGTLLVSLFTAMRFGDRSATTAAVAAALAIAIPTGFGLGSFQYIDYAERHTVAQLILVCLAGLPILFSALLAERDNNSDRWLRSEGLGQALLRILPDATYRISDDGHIVDAVLPSAPPDPALPPVEDLVGRHVNAVTDASIRDQLEEQLANARAGRPTAVIEYQRSYGDRRSDREVRFMRLPSGDTIAVARDITERKQAQRQLRLQAEILEMIATAARRPDIFDALVRGVEAQVPECLCSILLLQGDRLRLGAAPSLPDDYNAAVDGVRIGERVGCCGTAAFRNETVVAEDLQRSPLWADYRELAARHGLRACWSVPVRSATGSVLGTFAIYHRTPRAPATAELALVERAAVLAGLAIERERREALLTSIQHNVNEGLYRSIPGQGFAYVNDSFARLFGYLSASELRASWQRSQNAAHRQSLEHLVNETLSARHRELQLHRRDGAPFWALVSTSVQFHDDDAELICDGTVTDVTEHRQLEEQLRQAQKMEAVGQLAGGVAHDFNNLMTAITGFAESVKGELPLDSPLRDDVDQILIAGNRATTLTRQLLAFGRRQVLAPQVLELPKVIDEIGDMARRLIGEHIALTHEPARSSVRAKVDRGQLEQVILNLVINARDAMPRGGQIRVSTSTVDVRAGEDPAHGELPSGRYAALRVADDGCGMAPEVKARAFDPFFTTKGPGQGTGLGLSTVYGIVKQSGGSVTIDSAPGAGTTITVLLPFADELPRAAPQVLIPRPTNRTGTILVVEDEPFVLELAERALRHAGHTVLRARDGTEALTLFTARGDDIDAVVSDMVMPQLGGPELARRLSQLRPGVRILFMSGFAEDAAELNGERTRFLQKPFTASQLIEGVDELLGGAAANGYAAPT